MQNTKSARVFYDVEVFFGVKCVWVALHWALYCISSTSLQTLSAAWKRTKRSLKGLQTRRKFPATLDSPEREQRSFYCFTERKTSCMLGTHLHQRFTTCCWFSGRTVQHRKHVAIGRVWTKDVFQKHKHVTWVSWSNRQLAGKQPQTLFNPQQQQQQQKV